MSLDAASLSKMPGDALKGLYGMNDDMVLYWAHHEKLCLVDGSTAFMGGLDMCFGRWDTNQHTISDAHPTDLNEIIFPGQDYNNARVLDFQDVAHWERNQLDRKSASRMGWSDVALSLHGQAVDDLRRHFVERWNFIYDAKYESRHNQRYSRLALYGRPSSPVGQFHPQPGAEHPPTGQHYQQQQQQYPQPQNQPQHQPQHQENQQLYQQQQEAPHYQPYRPGAVSPSPNANSQGSPNYQHPPPDYSPSQAQAPQTTQGYTYTGQSFPPPPPGPPPNLSNKPTQPQQGQAPYFPPPQTQEAPHSLSRDIDDYGGTRGEGDLDRGLPLPRRFKKEDLTQYGNVLRGQLAGQIHQYQDRLTSFGRPQVRGNMSCQVVRSCAKWSHGSHTEHSIADAYAAIIRNSEHFVYIENQFFITATSDSQKPVKNKIGAAIVERILRAARAGQKYKIIVVIPSVPCFAGDLSDESTLGTRAIMEFQYNSINRGGNSIMELIAKEGYNPMEYIRFYNLRNYDRINASGPMAKAEQRSAVNYEEARKEHDLATAGPGGYGPGAPRSAFDPTAPYQQYQNAAHQVSGTKPSSGRWDSVSECYMLNGEDIRKVPWEGPSEAEIDALVTEELYVHTKVC